MGGLNIPTSKTLTLLGNISADSLTITPTQVGNLNRIYFDDVSNNTMINTQQTGGGVNNLAFGGTQNMNGALTTGSDNLAISAQNSMVNLTSGGNNTGISSFTLSQITTGSYNTSTGYFSGRCTGSSSYNSFYGYNSGAGSYIVNYCSSLGADSGFATNMNYSCSIGYGVVCTASNQIKIGRSTETTVFDGGVVLNNGLTATGTQTITFGTNAPVMSGASISAGSIPDSALSANIPLENASNTFTGLNAINNQYVHKAYGSVVSATTSLTTLSPIIYETYSISATSNFTITLPTVTATNVGQQITFRRVGGTTTTVISFAINGVQLVYNTALTGGTTSALMASGTYIVKLVGLLVTGTTYAYFQV